MTAESCLTFESELSPVVPGLRAAAKPLGVAGTRDHNHRTDDIVASAEAPIYQMLENPDHRAASPSPLAPALLKDMPNAQPAKEAYHGGTDIFGRGPV